MKQLTSATLVEFTTENNIFVGEFTGESFLRKEDDEKDKQKKTGDVIGYHFNGADGNEVLIGASATIKNIMEKKGEEIEAGQIMGFEWCGKGRTKAGRDYNKYKIHAFDSFEEANGYYNPVKG